MNTYECAICEDCKLVDQHGCNEHLDDEDVECICDKCFVRMLCADVDEVDLEIWMEGE